VKLKLISELKKMLNRTEYKIDEINDKIIINYGSAYLSPEDYIEIKIYHNIYEVCEIHKDIRKIGVKTDKKNDAIVFAIILCKRLYESNAADKIIAKKIRQFVDEGNVSAAKELLKENLFEDKYSLEYEIDGKICLIQQENKAYVKFHGKNLVENAKISRGFVALYNYSRNLMEISAIYNMLKLNYDFSYEQKEVEDIYIFGI